MNEPESARVAMVVPGRQEAKLLVALLASDGIHVSLYPDIDALTKVVPREAAAAIVAEESFSETNLLLLASVLAEQPEWSDFPVLILTGEDRSRLPSGDFGNFTLIERPLGRAALVSAVRTALRARRRQHQMRDRLDDQSKLLATIRENEDKLKVALEAAQLGSWELRMPRGDFVASEQCRRNLGLREEQPITYATVVGAIHPEDREGFERGIAAAFGTRDVYKAEIRILQTDGNTGWVLVAGRPVSDEDFTTRRMTGCTLDITERRRGEESIRESEAQLRVLADSIPQLAWMADQSGYIFWYNRRWYEYTGTTLDQMAGWGWQSVHDPQMLETVMKQWQTSLRTGGFFEMEFPLRAADGSFHWFLTQVRPVRHASGEVTRWFGTNTDIDEKRRAESALRESEELARSVVEGAPECVEVLDENGRTLLMNTHGCRRRGIKEGESGLHTPWVDSWKGENRNQARRALARALSGHMAGFRATSIGETGARVHWDVSATPIHGADGSVSKILCMTRDITAALKAEEEMRETAKLESLGVMAGGIAHDFNNLLTGIVGNASLLTDTGAEDDRELARDIVLAGERAADLTRQMLAYSGRGRFEVRKLDLSVMVRDILRLVKPSIAKNVEIALHLEDGCLLEGDPGQIQQVVMNLAINAGEAIEGGNGRIVVTTRRAVPGCPELGEGEYVCLEVRDNGKGMDEALKAKIFDPFFTTKFTGRGLGLAAVSGIVRGHKGALRVSSAPGEGTTFTVWFPSSPRANADHSAKKEPSVSTRSAIEVILLVDDEDVVQRIGTQVLTRQGFDVRMAGDGRQAVEVFRNQHHEIDLVILDMIMPAMNGEEALRAFREIDPKVPVVVCSGYSEWEVARRFSGQRIEGVLQKPYTSAQLVEKVRLVLDESRSTSPRFAD